MEQNSIKKHEVHSDKVEVVLRIRPILQIQEQQEFISIQRSHKKSVNSQLWSSTKETTLIKLNKPGNATYMKFANIFAGSSKQQTFFKNFEQTVKNFLEGIDGTIFAYGQTGAGKTYTMIGDCPEDNANYMENLYAITNKQRGILPRAMDLIISQVRNQKVGRVLISFYEIYNQKIYDLLSSNIKALDIRQNKGGDISIPGLLSLEVSNIKEAIGYIAEGIKNRVTSATKDNIKSSRSHSIFQIKYQRFVNLQSKKQQIAISTLRIIDLAGSEKFNIPYDISPSERQIRLQQLKSINSSLSKLGHCISALTHQNRTHIPFRDSKLTRILSQSLLGLGKVRVIVCISPSMSAMYQTISTLNFANHIKKAILNKPTPSAAGNKKTIQYEKYENLLKQFKKQQKIRAQLERLIKSSQDGLESNCISERPQAQASGLIEENQKLHNQISNLKTQLAWYQTNTNKSQRKQLLKPLNLKSITKPLHHGTQIHFHSHSLSPYQSKSLAITPRKKIKNNKQRQTFLNIKLNNRYKNTYRQGKSSKSIQNSSVDYARSQFSSKPINYKSKNSNKYFQKNTKPLKVNPFAQNKNPTKLSFEEKMRVFVGNQSSLQVDKRIKQKLEQIKKQLMAVPLLQQKEGVRQFQKLWKD